MKLQKMTVAAVAIAAALTMTACGSDEKTDSPTTTSKTTTTTTASDSTDAPVALPTAPELNAKVAQALDETVPAADKVNLVQGAEADPELINQVAAAAKAAGAQVEILDPVTDTKTASGSSRRPPLARSSALQV